MRHGDHRCSMRALRRLYHRGIPLQSPHVRFGFTHARPGRPALWPAAALLSPNRVNERRSEAAGGRRGAGGEAGGGGGGGRRWMTPPGAALALSLILRPKVDAAHAPRLTMLAGLAGCEAIE